jgi:AraC-like DNA-binding protein
LKEEKENKFYPDGISIYKRLYRSKEFIDDCFYEQIDLNKIARQAYFSPYHFLRLFKKIYNRTPHQYLTERRMDRAKELLKKYDSTVTSVCYEVGFKSLGSFSTLFTKYVGVSPLEFQKLQMRRLLLAVRFPEKLIPGCFLLQFKA